jgi:hypothetical protein
VRISDTTGTILSLSLPRIDINSGRESIALTTSDTINCLCHSSYSCNSQSPPSKGPRKPALHLARCPQQRQQKIWQKFTSTRFIETLNRIGITDRRTAYHQAEGNCYIERFHPTMKEGKASPLCFTSASLAHSFGDLNPRWRAPPPLPGRCDQVGTLSVCSRICFRARREWLILPSGWPIYATADGFFVHS